MGQKAYNRYFEGYKKEKVYHKNRKGYKFIYVYEGDYYKQQLEDSEWLRLKKRNLVAATVILLLYFYALTRNILSNRDLSVGGLALIVLIPLCILISGLVYSVFSPRLMTIRQYRQTHERIMQGSAWSMTLLVAVLAADGIFILRNHTKVIWGSELLNLFCYLSCLLIILYLRMLQKKSQFETSIHFKD